MPIIFPLLLLFVARSALSSNFVGSIALSSHSDEPSEGDTVELTCNITSTSLSAANRTKLYYLWVIEYNWLYEPWKFYPNSSGPAVNIDGNTIPGYSFKNSGRTLVIDSVPYYIKDFACQGSEDGENYGDYFTYCLQIRHKPYIDPINPKSKKFNAAINKNVPLRFECESYPPYSPRGIWTFVNFDGVSKNLPSNSVIGLYKYACYDDCSLFFNFTSVEYYGNYSFNMTNDMGSATITFQVLPRDPPEAPSNVRIQNVTHNLIVVEFNLMWSNSFDRQQPCLQLTQVETGAIVESSNASYYGFHSYNATYIYHFYKNIEPETNYKVSVWSRNEFGKSQVVEMEVKTQKDPNFPSLFFLNFFVSLGFMSIAVLISYLMKRFRRNRQPQQLSQIAMQEVNAGSPQSDAVVVYERVRVVLRHDEHTCTSI